MANTQRSASNDRNAQRDARGSMRIIPPRSEKNVVVEVSNVDFSISITVTFLVLIGLVMVFSSSYFVASRTGDPLYFFKRQGTAAIMGFCAMFILANFSYRYLKKLSFLIYMAANVLLVVVQLIGDERGGARRWLEIPIIGLSLQPSEIAKVGVILLVATIIAGNKDILKSWGGFIFCSIVVGISCVLVAWGNLSTAIIVAIIGFGIIFIASPYTGRFVFFGAIGAASLVSFIMFGGGFRTERFLAWRDPFAFPRGVGYQIIQSLFAVGSGGFFGLGLGNSRQKMGFLPEAHNDIIFAVISEELGFFGASIILMLFGILIWRGLKVAINAVDLFGSLVATGAVLLIGSQVVINVAVVTNSIPNTGVPLPFISFGGTSLTITMALMGILLNISRHSRGSG